MPKQANCVLIPFIDLICNTERYREIRPAASDVFNLSFC